MTNPQEYNEEVQKVQDSDFTHNWVSSSAFLFYLQVACIVVMLHWLATTLPGSEILAWATSYNAISCDMC